MHTKSLLVAAAVLGGATVSAAAPAMAAGDGAATAAKVPVAQWRVNTEIYEKTESGRITVTKKGRVQLRWTKKGDKGPVQLRVVNCRTKVGVSKWEKPGQNKWVTLRGANGKPRTFQKNECFRVQAKSTWVGFIKGEVKPAKPKK
ncbi:hypothetical protein ACSNOI_08965 [Actinomadura kijaniata]|uniref:hypothetical protein n=1 Tax=Actinomadura kijaniata TaxID=46161 RepID=UPI003F1E1CCE